MSSLEHNPPDQVIRAGPPERQPDKAILAGYARLTIFGQGREAFTLGSKQ